MVPWGVVLTPKSCHVCKDRKGWEVHLKLEGVWYDYCSQRCFKDWMQEQLR